VSLQVWIPPGFDKALSLTPNSWCVLGLASADSWHPTAPAASLGYSNERRWGARNT
jgi:hypothetical protein